jgi:DNA-binding phage protein
MMDIATCVDTFRVRLNQVVNAKRQNITAISRDCGVSATQMYKWLNGESLPSSNRLLKICDALSVTPNWLFGIGEGSTDEL